MYSFGERMGLTPEAYNPASRIERFPESRRERFLSKEELGRLGEAFRRFEGEGRFREGVAALRLLLFTGARLREILHLRWEHVDFDRGLLFLPDSKTGKKTITLGAPAMMALSSLERVGGCVIAGANPNLPRADLEKPWPAVTEAAGLEGLSSRRSRAFCLCACGRNAPNLRGAWRRDPAFLRHALEHCAIGLAIVAPHDAAQRRVRLHVRAIDADALALHEAALGDELREETEYLLVNLMRQTRARLRQSRMIRNFLARRQPEKIPQRKRVGATPHDAAFAVEPFEVADHVHPEMAPWRQRRRASVFCYLGISSPAFDSTLHQSDGAGAFRTVMNLRWMGFLAQETKFQRRCVHIHSHVLYRSAI